MAHFAELDENNVVLRVIVVHNNETHGADGVEQEALGQAFCTNLLGGNWKQTSYNHSFRKNFAQHGSKYDAALDAFVPAQPFPSWVLTEACQWESPVARPAGPRPYQWDEATLTWQAVVFPQPFPSWVQTEEGWRAPVPHPADGKPYRWDEATLAWLAFEPPAQA